MKLTVAGYADSRHISEATAKKAISDKGWELEQNPNDKRQRLLTLQQQAELDQAIPKANPPSATPSVPVEVVAYDRPVEVGMVLAERAITVGEITYQHQAATDNPLYQAMQQRLKSMQGQQHQITQQLTTVVAANLDTAAAIDGLKQMEIVQNAQARAARDWHLEQQAYNQTKQHLEMQAAGLTPISAPAAPAAPAPERIVEPSNQSTPF